MYNYALKLNIIILYFKKWGLGIGDWPNPQSPIPNPQSPMILIF